MTEKLIYNILLIALFFISIIVFIMLFFLPAPYGRFTSKNWGIRINARLAWIVMESPAVIIIITCFLISNRIKNIVAIVFLLIWMIHYMQRTFVYPFLMRTRNKTFPISIILFSILFNCLNGYLNGRYLFNFSQPYPASWFKDARFITGALIFIAGYAINIYSDSKLRQLRKPGEFSYKIPYGGFFRYISSPNYFGEIIEWIGWAVATWSLPGLAFAVFTIANLMPRALSNHKWYLENFPDYPKDRKALIPFIY
jgi:protein-S-isoprenylcysteine O-methyltransferase Ste14